MIEWYVFWLAVSLEEGWGEKGKEGKKEVGGGGVKREGLRVRGEWKGREGEKGGERWRKVEKGGER